MIFRYGRRRLNAGMFSDISAIFSPQIKLFFEKFAKFTENPLAFG